MEIDPINSNIIIEVDKTGDTTEHGVVVAHDKGARTESVAIKGTVISIAKDFEELKEDPSAAIKRYVLTKPKVRVGQTVWIEKWQGQKVNHNGKEYVFIKQEFILGILREKNT